MLAQLAQTDGLPGWFALILQGGSFAVLVFLMLFGLPKLRREIAEEQRNERDDFKTTLRNISETFKAEAAAERAACEKHFDTLAHAMGRGNEATIQAVKTMAEQIHSHAERNRQWSAVLQAEIAKHKGEDRA